MRLEPEATRSNVVDVAQVEQVVARIARIPPKSVSASDRDLLRNLERDLKLVIFGQDAAVEGLAAAIKMARSGLREPEKPVGAFLFAGPTGVGKTEVTRQLAHCLGIELIRFDMSEYMERHAVSRLIMASSWCSSRSSSMPISHEPSSTCSKALLLSISSKPTMSGEMWPKTLLMFAIRAGLAPSLNH